MAIAVGRAAGCGRVKEILGGTDARIQLATAAHDRGCKGPPAHGVVVGKGPEGAGNDCLNERFPCPRPSPREAEGAFVRVRWREAFT